MEKKKELKWYNNAGLITTLIIGVILLIIVCSQSYAIGGKMSLTLFGSIINHNSVYLLILVYFVVIQFNVGKKYFNYLNVFLLFIYLIAGVTSLLTLVQAPSLNTILSFILNLLYVIYLIHTLFRDTRFWKEFKINKSPFNELSNDTFYYSIVTVACMLLVVNLISTVVISGIVISLLDTIYYVLFARYIYLYSEFLNSKKLGITTSDNLTSIKEGIKESFDEIDSKVQEVFNPDEISNTIKDTADGIKDTVGDVLDKTKIDEKVVEVKDNIVDSVKEVLPKEEKKTTKKKSTTKKTTTKKKDTKKKGDK